MATLQECLTGIKAQMPSGLRTYDYVPEDLNPPAAVPVWRESTPETMGRGKVTHLVNLYVLVSSASDRSGQLRLAEYVAFTGANSIWVAFGHNNDLDIAGGQTTATLESVRALGLEEVAAYGYYGAVFQISVTTPGV